MASRSVKVSAWAGAVFSAGFILLQFIRPGLTLPPVTGDLQAPPAVKDILRTACYDCHSNETRLAWFDRIVPAYWFVVSDVNAGRQRLNFSEIANRPAADHQAALFDAVNQTMLGEMAPQKYRVLHPAANVSPEQMKVLMQYLLPSGPTAASPPEEWTAAAEQREKWIASTSSESRQPVVVHPAPNGIAFPAGYTGWRTLSSTDRLDNHTIRLVLGNDVAIAAVTANHTNPWPDGTMLAKVAWDRLVDEQGHVQAGAFKQVEFMLRDSRKYASTDGWGWGRWRGTDLQPYGDSPQFTSECVGCHAPMRNRDHVYTAPAARVTTSRVVHTSHEGVQALPFDPFDWEVISPSSNESTSTVAVLYGNEVAVRHARTRGNDEYPVGSVLSLVTWRQQDDPRWFGAKIPDELRSIEFVTVTLAADGPTAKYDRYEGEPLLPSTEDISTVEARIYALLHQPAAVMP